MDTGLSGCLCFFDDKHGIHFFDMPCVKIKSGNKLDVEKLVDYFTYLAPDIVVYENNTMGAKLVKTVGIIEGIAGALKIESLGISPQKWQRELGLIGIAKAEKKEASRMLARKLYPGVKGIERKKDHNRAESLLIGHWYLTKGK